MPRKMDKELWKDVKNYEGLYQVSNYGRVKRLEGLIYATGKHTYTYIKKERILKPILCCGYLYVSLSKHNKRKNVRIHKLVAEAFIPNPNNYNNIDHKDTNKQNNRADNLIWCTNVQNMNNPLTLEKMGKPVYQFTKNGEFIKEWRSGKYAQEQLNICHISACCLGKRKTAGGYVWRYKKEFSI